MNGQQLADALRGGGACVGRGFYSAHISANHHGDQPAAYMHLSDQADVGRLPIK